MGKMVVEIWSDVMCPFCYIGKRRFEKALAQFSFKDEVEVIWKSFQLNPNLKTTPNVNAISHLANTKGWSHDYAMNATRQVSEMAKNVGLQFKFDKAVVANSFNAHRLLQFAKTKGKGAQLKESLLKAYFTEGKNIDDAETLAQLAVESGLNLHEVNSIITNANAFANEVNFDLNEAKTLGISGVPFFVIDRKFGISGAQETSVFLEALQHAHSKASKQEIQ